LLLKNYRSLEFLSARLCLPLVLRNVEGLVMNGLCSFCRMEIRATFFFFSRRGSPFRFTHNPSKLATATFLTRNRNEWPYLPLFFLFLFKFLFLKFPFSILLLLMGRLSGFFLLQVLLDKAFVKHLRHLLCLLSLLSPPSVVVSLS